MRAAVLHECPGWLEITDVQVDAPEPREVLVRTAAAGLCHSDHHFMEGKYPAITPIVMGHESAGVVEAAGSEVRYIRPLDEPRRQRCPSSPFSRRPLPLSPPMQSALLWRRLT